VGNFFFSGARLFFASLETAIFWFCRISGISPNTNVIPVVNNNVGLTIGVELHNGTKIFGQNDVSDSTVTNITNEISHPPKSVDTLHVNKEDCDPLDVPIKRLFYLTEDKHEISPPVNPNVIKKIKEQDHIVSYQ
jgi:hypothetical protein